MHHRVDAVKRIVGHPARRDVVVSTGGCHPVAKCLHLMARGLECESERGANESARTSDRYSHVLLRSARVAGIPMRSSDRRVRFARLASPGRHEMCEGGCGTLPQPPSHALAGDALGSQPCGDGRAQGGGRK